MYQHFVHAVKTFPRLSPAAAHICGSRHTDPTAPHVERAKSCPCPRAPKSHEPGLIHLPALGSGQLCQNPLHDCLPLQERTILFVVDASIQEAFVKIGKLVAKVLQKSRSCMHTNTKNKRSLIATQQCHLQEAGKPLAKGRDYSQRPPSLAEDLNLKLHGQPPCCPLRSSMPR